MNTLGKKTAFLLMSTALFSGCEKIDPLAGEQYFKQLYIVGASSIVSSFNVPYRSNPSDAYISIAVGGSLNIPRDVTVTVSHYDQAIDWYNDKYMIDAPVRYQALAMANYDVPSMSTTVRSGERYARLPFTVATQGLHCDSLYAVTFRIDAVSDHEKTKTDTVLILNLALVNDYSGSYQMDVTRTAMNLAGGAWEKGASTTLSATRTLRAVDPNTVRFFNEARVEVRGGYASHEDYFDAIKKHCVTFAHTSNGNFAIAAWDELDIADPGSCAYENGTFTYVYDYMDGNTRYRMEGTLTRTR